MSIPHPTSAVPRTPVSTPGRSGSVATQTPVSRRYYTLCVYTGRLYRTAGCTRSQTPAQSHPISWGVCPQRCTPIPHHPGRERRFRRPTTSPKTAQRPCPTPTPIKANSPDQTSPDQPIAPLTWATRLKRVFNIDITLCPHCGERLRVIADITQPEVIHTILEHLKQRPSAADTARAPPAKAPGRATPAENPNSLSA